MPLYVPSETLPIYPTYSTVVKDGVKYKTYLETDWHQVMTEDGVPLCDLLRSMPSYNTTNFYRFCGIFKASPKQTAIEQLYALTTQLTGDVYLVETDMVTESGKVYESYVWLSNESGWVYCGTTNRKASINRDLPDVIRLFPDELGEPNQVLVVGEDGKTLSWGSNHIGSHNTDSDAHQDIRDALSMKSDRLIIFNDVLSPSGWTFNGNYPCFEYIYSSDNLPGQSYFDITPVVNSQQDALSIAACGISPVYQIHSSENTSYAVLRAKRVPSVNIPICVKCFGKYNEK